MKVRELINNGSLPKDPEKVLRILKAKKEMENNIEALKKELENKINNIKILMDSEVDKLKIKTFNSTNSFYWYDYLALGKKELWRF